MDEESKLKQEMSRMVTGFWVSKAVHVAAKLGIADLLGPGPMSVADLAQTTGTHERALYRLLRALASVGVFRGLPDGTFELTPLAATLRSGPQGMRAFAVMAGDHLYEAWSDLFHSISTGGVAFEKRFGRPFFEHLSERTESDRQVFDEAMEQIHGHETQAMLSAYDFSGFGTIADIGGGNGSVLASILEKSPKAHGILFDLPHVVERARPGLTARGLAERCRTEVGSFFEVIPPGADCYLMRHVIHDWNDDQCATILGNCRKAMGRDARLLVIEAVIPEGNEFFFEKFLDLNMMAVPGGQERTKQEYEALFRRAGLALARVIPTAASISLIEARVR